MDNLWTTPRPGQRPAAARGGPDLRIIWRRTTHGPAVPRRTTVYFTDRGIEELEKRRGEEEVTFEWLAEQLRTFVDLNPDFEVPVERLATWLARLDDEDDE